ncbi:hypothetical protein BB8028_0004g07290 [Beauveria bassiana]|uniref:2EXR domain-containing protein n=1 Tax=Beauveria bassiana TaxID=176275 RepID=A0A2S7YC81_BEABA|nr:hypothetical protein BB8028_0004g07290 [Beauveria bassiana]
MKNCAFQLFPQLPPEIRACIWRHAIEPRIVPVTCWVGNQRAEAINTSRATHGAGWESDLAAVRRRRQNQKDPTTMTQLPLELYAVALHKPPVLDVCRETRSIGLYEPMILTPGSSASYAWVNYNVDVIHLQDDQEPYTRFRNCDAYASAPTRATSTGSTTNPQHSSLPSASLQSALSLWVQMRVSGTGNVTITKNGFRALRIIFI